MPSYNLPAVDSNGNVTNHSVTGLPTLGTVGTNWAAGPTNTGHDLAGTVTVTSGTTPAAGTVVPVTFATPFAKAPASVTLSGALQAYASAVTAAGFTITSLVAAASTTAYTFSYNVDA